MSLSSNSTLKVESADVIRLIESHLIESGLHESSRVLREESGVGSAGLASSSHALLSRYCCTGEWGEILKILSALREGLVPNHLMAQTFEMAILELGEHGDMELAYATLRLAAEDLDYNFGKSVEPKIKNASSQRLPNDDEALNIPPSRILEQKLAALMSLRSKSPTQSSLPLNYYGESTRQQRREIIGEGLSKAIPILPPSRLNVLLQQAIKWQTFTGQLPTVRKIWEEEDAETKGKTSKKPRKTFDLVLGEVDVANIGDGDPSSNVVEGESIPSKPYSSIKFGKKATAECALFLPDASGLITGSSDGLVEIWDSQRRFAQLRMDLTYQKQEELLGHEAAIMAMALSNDGAMLVTGDLGGTVKVWNLESGKCLREINAHESTISSLALVPDGTHILTASHDGTCREFGLRTSRLLKEFRGHTSYVQTCKYIQLSRRADDDDDEEDSKRSTALGVVSGGADGTVRIWDYRSAEVLRVLRPLSLGSLLSSTGSSLVIDAQSDLSNAGGSPTIHTVCCLHTPQDTLIVVPRGSRAFLVNYQGLVLQTFQDPSSKDAVFVAATVSPSNRWFYAVRDDGVCCVFDVMRQGELETTIRNFATETTAGSSQKEPPGTLLSPEITGLVHHPHKGILAAFSSDKNQKKGRLTLWR